MLIPRCIATKKTHSLLHRTPTATTADVFNRNLRLERLCDANATAEKGGCAASRRWCNKGKNTRENDHGNALQTNAHRFQRDGHAHPQIALGVEEKAEQLEKELEQRAVTDRVVPIQNETD